MPPVILVTNDDGVHAAGLAALAAALEDLGDVYVVAPDREQSAVGHALTLHRPLRVTQMAERRFAVNGTPSDCVNLAVLGLLPERPVLVAAGINHGSNLGDDVTYSGTVSAAMEGTLLGVPSMAVSRGDAADSGFESAGAVARLVASRVLVEGLPAKTLLNVNVPSGPASGIKMTRLGHRVYREEVVRETDRGGAAGMERRSGLGHGRRESRPGQRDAAAPRPDPLRRARAHGGLGVGPQLAAEEAAAVIEARRRPGAVATGEQRYGRERERMVAEQLVKRGISDPAVLEAMRNVPRHLFVDEALRDRAYGDHPLPIGDGQTISQPFMVARMTELLQLTGREKVLEIGTGSGYQAAVLSRLAARVCTIERIPRLAARARQVLESIGASNVWVRAADGTMGWVDEAPFDRIVVAAGGPSVPPPLVDQLADGGRLVMPVGPEDAQRLKIVDKRGGQTQESEDSGCVFVKLIGKYAWEA